MPVATVKVIEGVFSPEEKQTIISRVTEALVSVEGEALRDKTLVLIEEVASGDYGMGGEALTTEMVRQLRGL